MNFWPFKKKAKIEQVDPSTLNYTQVDITEYFDQNLSLSKDEWVPTIPINVMLGHDNHGNLPAMNAGDHEIYRIAMSLSEIREEFQVADDGVYCPVCHLANIDIGNLGKECPKCARPLLAFGWK
jgi:hypothetical protein